MTPRFVSIYVRKLSIVIRTGISIRREVAGPGDKSLTLVLAGGDGVRADGRDDGGVA